MSLEKQLSDLTEAVNNLTAVLSSKMMAAATSASVSAPSTGAVDFASQIQKPIVAMAAAGKRETAVGILKQLGAARASDIKPEDYAKAVELIKAAS